MPRNFSRTQVLDAIEGSGGIVVTVARRLGCAWATARKYIDQWESTRQAFEAEREQILDLAEGVVFRNIQNAAVAQKDGAIVDSSDAKWLLARLGKARGYTERIENEITSADAVGDKKVYLAVSPDDWDEDGDGCTGI